MKQKSIKKKYDLTADVYDERYKDIQFEKFKLMLQDIQLHGKILDHGCGTGLLAEFLNTPLFGIDISFKMLKRAKQRRELVVQGDLEHLPFKARAFDNILSFTALQNTEHPDKALNELKRISNRKIILTHLAKFDFSKQINKKFDVQEIRQAGEDIGFIL
ncbi:methyltransferase domain-containing protein [Candidatus Woesearchaeota archaeon]|nr:methyltransferase domain-containing protein [Candidatus Woesearchaeota archaeon]